MDYDKDKKSWYDPKIDIEKIFTKKGTVRGHTKKKISRVKLAEYLEDPSLFIDDYKDKFSVVFIINKFRNEQSSTFLVVETWMNFLFLSGSDFGIIGPFKNYKDLSYDEFLVEFLTTSENINITEGELTMEDLKILLPRQSNAQINLYGESISADEILNPGLKALDDHFDDNNKPINRYEIPFSNLPDLSDYDGKTSIMEWLLRGGSKKNRPKE